MKIVMFGQKRIPSREGGVEIVVEELATRMVERGNIVCCYNRKGHHVSGKEFDTQKIKEYKGVCLVEVPTINKKGLAAMSSSVFASIKASFSGAEIVHIHAEGPAFMAWLPKMFGKKVVVTIHGLDWNRAKWGRFASWYIKTGEKNAVRFADKIIVLSEDVKKYFYDTYKRETFFIPNGVNRPVMREASEIKNTWGLTKDSYILFLGRLVPEKGIHYLIQAYKKVNTGKKLVIVGGTSDTNDYTEELRKLGQDENIIFTGFQQGDTLEELFSNAYIYCLPSDLEGMPLSLLEAMSYGNCCLTSDISECKDVIEDRGETFEKGNISDLVAKIQMLIDDEKKVFEYKKNASEFICEKYNWDDVVEKTLEIYMS